MNGDWWITARQSIPRLRTLIGSLEPTLRLDDARGVTPTLLREIGIRAVVWDVDGTLMSYHGDRVDPDLEGALDALSAAGVPQAVLSNCGEERFVELGRIFPELPLVRAYDGKGGRVYRVRRGAADDLGPGEVRALLDGGSHPVRKPDGPVLRYALSVLGVEAPGEGLMVGDQYLTDVASANLAGARSVKVPTWRQDTFPWPVRFSQWLEGWLYRFRAR